MIAHQHATFEHEHVFLGSQHARNERRVWLVIALTATMMCAEIAAGAYFGSMALFADGWHMATHAAAMLITALAYLYARKHANDRRYTFGTGKVGDLAAFASAVVLALISLFIAWESAIRLVDPVAISFNQAIGVAVLGLAVNLLSAWLLRDEDHAHHGHSHGSHHSHDHAHEHHAHDHHSHDAHQHEHHAHGNRDNNLRAAYLHVLADALTSVLAIAALLVGKSLGWVWADPLMGIIGALIIARWSWSLIRDSSNILLDRTAENGKLEQQIRAKLGESGATITDLHTWQVGPGHHAAIIALVAEQPHAPVWYKHALDPIEGLSHVTVEVEAARAH